MARVMIRYWAAAKDAAGIPEESVEADSLAEALNAAITRRQPGARLSEVFARSSFLVNAAPVGRAARETYMLDEGAVIEVLPPFAGG